MRAIQVTVPETLIQKTSLDFQVLIFFPNIEESSFIIDRTDPNIRLYFFFP